MVLDSKRHGDFDLLRDVRGALLAPAACGHLDHAPSWQIQNDGGVLALVAIGSE
jgi:hypothetical protein